MACDIRIGTSGFHYKHWKGPFYPPKMPDAALLGFYTQHFDTLELNNSFYRLPTEEAFHAWRDAAPGRTAAAGGLRHHPAAGAGDQAGRLGPADDSGGSAGCAGAADCGDMCVRDSFTGF